MPVWIKQVGLLLAVSWLPALAYGATAGTDWRQGEVVDRVGQLEFRECELTGFGRSRQAECAVLEVPEDYDRPEGRTLSLFIARLASGNANPEPDPMLAIAGGPGQAASESFLLLDRIFSKVSNRRDFYLVDQRGTGRSHPQHCDTDDEATLMLEINADQIRDMTLDCLAQFDGDPRFYTTSIAIEDFERVRRALEVEQWNLFGTSYGTRVGQHYMRRHPDSIRTAVLDSVIHPAMNLGPEIPVRSQDTLDAVLRRCAQSAPCNDRFPDLEAGLDRLLESLGEAPRTVAFEDLQTGEHRELQFTSEHLIGLLRMSLYSPEQISTLPPMLHAAYARENFSALARGVSNLVEELDLTIAMGMHNSVVCTEDVRFYDPGDIDRDAIEASYMGDRILRTLIETCRHWPVGEMDEDFKEPLTSGIPSLLFSGEQDPITPPAYAETAARGLSRARHFVLPGQGHSVSFRGCAPVMVARFVEAGSADELDGQCLERLGAEPLFLNLDRKSVV